MHRLLIILLLTLCASISMSAQNDTLFVELSPVLSAEEYPGILTRRGAKLYLDGTRLSEDDVSVLFSNIKGEDYYKRWKALSSERIVGIALIPTSVAFAFTSYILVYAGSYSIVLGSLLSVFNGASITSSDVQPSVSLVKTGAIGLFIISPTVLLSGIGFLCGGSVGMSKTVKMYNNAQVSTLAFGLTNSGNLGLTLNF